MKKIKKILLSSTAVLPLLPLTTISCQKQNVEENQFTILLKKQVPSNPIQAKWDKFLSYSYVQTLLKLVFGNDEVAKQKYIKSQQQLDNDYVKKLNWSLFYGNNIIGAFGTGVDDFDFFATKPIFYKQSINNVYELFNKNWLWFLFNLSKMEFALNSQFDKFKSTVDNTINDVHSKSLKLGSFYTPQSNEVVQYTTQEYENDNDKKVLKVYLLTKEGFILRFEITSYPSDPSYAPSAEMFSFIYTYPSIFDNKNLNDEFNIKKYVTTSQSFYTAANNRTSEILFGERYGGEPIRFTLVYVK